VRSARAVVTTPAGAWLAARMLGWVAVLPILKRTLPLPKVVRLCSRPSRAERRRVEREGEITALARRIYARSPVHNDNCLERSLVLYRFLSEAGAEPVLFVGVGKDANGIIGHAWVSVDGEPVHESHASLAPYAPVAVFGPDGRRRPDLEAGSVDPVPER
jgi:hypothetical protein